MEQPKKKVEGKLHVDKLLDRVLEAINCDEPYIQKLKKYIDDAKTTNEVSDVLAFLRMNEFLDKEENEVTIFGYYGVGLKAYAEVKINRLQKEDKRKGLSLIQ